MQRLAAWSVHLLTASGAALGFAALIAVGQGAWIRALILLGVACLIDSVDGTLARAARVRETLPRFDGTLLDNLVDYLNYVVVPAYLLAECGGLPAGWGAVGTCAICLASAYQFSRRDAKTDDGRFRGFPGYWNVVAFYVLVLEPPPWGALGLVLLLCAMVFVPVLYVNPWRTRPWRRLTASLTLAWVAAVAVILATHPQHPVWLARGSLLYAVYYFALSVHLTRRQPAGDTIS
jgi:phosphatidylcholine synthase